MKTYGRKAHSKSLGTLSLAALIAAGTLSAISLPSLHAQPDATTAKAINPPNRQKGKGKKGKGNREAAAKKMMEREMALVEAVNGKPLTEDQKTKVATALTERIKATRELQDTYLKSVAAATGLTVDELEMKMRQQRRQARKRNGGAAGMPAQ